MRQYICLLLFVLFPVMVLAGSAGPTPVPYDRISTAELVKIPARIPVNNNGGRRAPSISAELSGLIVGVSYIYNRMKTEAVAVMLVPKENEAAVKSILQKNRIDIKKGMEAEIEKVFPNFKVHVY